tara:strand:- start:9917 stop:10396 length:480 start_codon:yes stop_codon:yes gene_type:complete
MAKKPKKTQTSPTIALNKKARHDYHLEEKLEAGLSLQGWEVKSLRAGNAQLTDSYVLLQNGEAYLMGLHISPLKTVSTHYVTDPTRTRKLLLHQNELSRLFNSVNQKGHTCVATALYWKGHLVKCEIALAKGKQAHDKRESEKDRDWQRQKQRLMRHSS